MRGLAEVGALRISLGLDSIDFTQGMKNINTRLNALNSEFKAISTGSAKFDRSLDTLRTRSDVLTRSFETHKRKVEELKRKYEESKAAKGEDAAETLRMATAYNNALTAMNKVEHQLKTVNEQFKEQSTGFADLEKGVNANVEGMDRQLRVLESGYAASAAGATDLGRTVEGLQQKEQHLTSTLNIQKEQVKELTRLYQESVRLKGIDAEQTQEIQIRLNRATQAMRETEGQLTVTNTQVEQQSNFWYQLAESVTASGESLQTVGEQLQQSGAEVTQSFGAAFLSVSAALGVSANSAMDFESQMSSVKSVMAPEDVRDYSKALEELAVKMGEDTKYSALEAAQGIEELVKAGVSVKDIMDGGLDGALSLATAGELELADAAEIASTALNAFRKDNLSVMDAADLLAGAANASATSVSELKFGLSAVASVASGVGLSFKDTSTALAVFAQNGLKGSDAGTSLKTMLLNLSPHTTAAADMMDSLNLGTTNAAAGYKYLKDRGLAPLSKTVTDVNETLRNLAERQAGVGASTAKIQKAYVDLAKKSGFASSAFYDANGNLKSMAQIAGILQKALSKLNSEQRQNALQTMFGTDAIRAGNILFKEGAKGVENMATAMTKIKSADVAASKLDNVKGRIEALKGSIETAAISVGTALLPTFDKIVKSIQKATDWFNNLSTETKQNIADFGLMAAGVTGLVTVIGGAVAITGSIVSTFGTLTTALGTAAGAASFLTGPIGLVAGGLALATTAIVGYSAASKKAKEINLDHAKSLIDQQQSLETLTDKYDKLREKNELSNYELLRFRDIQKELETAKSAESIKKLKDESEKLREKSGLTNDEMEEMLDLNDKLIEKVPEAGQAFSDQGSKILKNADDLNAANNKLRENIQLELELQKTKAEAKLDQNIRDQIESIDELNDKVRDLNNAKIEAAAKEYQLEQMKKQQQDAYAAGQDALAESMNLDIERLQQEVKIQNDQVGSVAAEVQEKQKSVEKTTEQIKKTQELFGEMINLQLAQAGITEKGAAGIAQLDQSIQKTMDRKFELLRLQEAQGGLNTKQQEELDKLDSALGKYKTAKSSIGEIQSEQESVNKKIDAGTSKAEAMSEVLSASEVKDIKFTGDGYTEAKIISKEASASAKKEISVTDYGKTHSIHNEAGKGASKTITIGAVLSSTFRAAVNAFEAMSHIDIPGFATGTRNAPGGLSLVGEEGPELMYLPTGAKVIPNGDTEAILRNWNIPMLASGGVTLSAGMALVGEKGRELLDLRGAGTAPLPTSDQSGLHSLVKAVEKLASREISIAINGREFIRATSNEINDVLDLLGTRRNRMGGVL